MFHLIYLQFLSKLYLKLKKRVVNFYSMQEIHQMALFSVNLNFIATLKSVMYWNQKSQNKVYFPLKSNFFKAIQVNTKITDFEFFLKIDHMLRYGRKARRISNFEGRILEQNLFDVDQSICFGVACIKGFFELGCTQRR